MGRSSSFAAMANASLGSRHSIYWPAQVSETLRRIMEHGLASSRRGIVTGTCCRLDAPNAQSPCSHFASSNGCIMALKSMFLASQISRQSPGCGARPLPRAKYANNQGRNYKDDTSARVKDGAVPPQFQFQLAFRTWRKQQCGCV